VAEHAEPRDTVNDTTKTTALFPTLLGARFPNLDAKVRRVHGGQPGQWSGTASIKRGNSYLAQIACAMAGLPAEATCTPVIVDIETGGTSERWTRRFAGSKPMRSTLARQGTLLRECLGAATLIFTLAERDGGIDWLLERIYVLGCRLPRVLFTVSAHSGSGAAGYRFVVEARLRGIGRLIRYEGELDVGQ
jgi:hypothetical protein